MSRYNLVSLAGVAVLLAVAWIFSTDRRTVNWRLLGGGLALQALFALFVFHVPAGSAMFRALNTGVLRVLQAASAGQEFLFGPLAAPPGAEGSLGFILAFQGLPTIVFFSALMAILYYIRLMPLLVRGFAWVFTRLLGVSGAESLCAASNIFVGVESAFTVRPYLSRMTRSELTVVLTAGMATVASNVLALYVMSLQRTFPSIAGHLVSASVLSAPAALIMAKLLVPETDHPVTLGKVVAAHYEREPNVFEAVINGANAGLKLVLGISALLLAVLGLVALADMLLGAFGGWSLARVLGLVCYPFALVLGVHPADAPLVAELIGLRAVATEIPAYRQLAAALEQGAIQPRSAVIATYALCGFAHVASMAIFVGGVTALVPEKTSAVAGTGFRALLAATLACLLTAAMAGIFYTPGVETILLAN